jgi:hypothetical protein
VRLGLATSPAAFYLFSFAQARYLPVVTEPTDFLRWVTDPARTNDELFTVELLIERMRPWQHWPFHDRQPDFETKLKTMKARKPNPGYRPALPLDELEALQERADTVTHFSSNGASDRPLRDLTALRFFPALENISISSVALTDLSPLAPLAKLNWLTLMEHPDLSGGPPVRLRAGRPEAIAQSRPPRAAPALARPERHRHLARPA